MRVSNVIIISATLLPVVALFRTIDSFAGPNLGTILQLFGTLSILAAVGLLVIRSLQIICQRVSQTKT